MAIARHILERPAQFQWDSDSYPCKSDNCRPTAAAMIAGYYRDMRINIHSMRKAMQNGSGVCGGTNCIESARGMTKYGVRAGYSRLYASGIKTKVRAGIPVDMPVLYRLIPKSLRQDDNFGGLHSVVACKIATKNGVLGMLIRDPDRWGTGKVSYVFWPDSAWIPAFNATDRWCAYPLSAKKISSSVLPYSSYPYVKKVRINANGLRVRSAPNLSGRIEKSLARGTIVSVAIKTDKGGIYTGPSGKSTSWVAYKDSSGKYHWIAAAYVSVV